MRRYPAGIPQRIVQLIEHELELIGQLRYEAYFLTVFDLVRFARERGILCQGRGSAANSVVCYCLEITSVDPDRLETLFERFISRERNEAPDIDVDFEHERREEVLQYLYEKYGRDRAGMTAEVITYRPRMAMRDVGKALGLSLDRIDRLAKDLDSHQLDEHFAGLLPGRGHRPRLAGRQPAGAAGRRTLVGFPRHLGQHVGGMVITRGPLDELVPIENAAMPGRTVIEWDKDDLDELGILKVDCLALGMLTALGKCFDLVARHAGRSRQLEHSAPSRRAGLRHDLPGRHHRRLSNRKPGPDGDAAALATARILRSGDRSRDRAARPHPRQDGPSLLAPPLGDRAGHLSQRRGPGRARANARRAAVSGTGHAVGGGGRRLHAGPGRSTAPRHGRLAATGRHRRISPQADRWHARPRAFRRICQSTCSSRFVALANTVFPNRTRPVSRCWSMLPPG